MPIEVGDVLPDYLSYTRNVIEDIVQKEYDKGTKGKYYIHLFFRVSGDEFQPIYQARRTRPSPYQQFDHYLWSVEDGGLVKSEWCIPKKEVIQYILQNPDQFHPSYVTMLKQFCNDKIEKIEDYVVDGKIS